LDNLVFVLAGFFAGSIGSMLGLGGGFLVIPLLIFFFHFSPQQVAGTTLVMIFFNSLSATLAYSKQKRIDYQSAWKFALATVPGAIGGSYISRFFTPKSFALAFGFILIIVALGMLGQKEKKTNNIVRKKIILGTSKLVPRFLVDSSGKEFSYQVNEILGITLSFFVGILSSALGIGGGVIHVPAMIYTLNFPAHIATATSNVILLVSSFGGATSHFFLGHVNLAAGLSLGLGAVAGAQLGAWLAQKINPSGLIKILALVLIITGIRLIFM